MNIKSNLSTNPLSLCGIGQYKIISIGKDIGKDFLDALTSYGFEVGQVLNILKESDIKRMFIEVNERKYLLRRKTVDKIIVEAI